MARSKAEHALTSESTKISSFNSVAEKKKKKKPKQQHITCFGLNFLMRKIILKKEKKRLTLEYLFFHYECAAFN